MKLALILLALIAFISCSIHPNAELDKRLASAYIEKNYFVLNTLMASIDPSKKPEYMLYKATLDNVFNKPEESTKGINLIIKKHTGHFSDTIISQLLQLRVINSMRLQDYKNAFLDDSLILANYKNTCDSDQLNSIKADLLLNAAAVDFPRMSVIKKENVTLGLKKDIAGLVNLPVTIKNDTLDFVFDTGAGLSGISYSVAKKTGVNFTGKKIPVGSITGGEIEAELGLLDFKLGSIEIKNAIFVIMPDENFSFNNGAYKIQGIVGFPVMYALEEISLQKDQLFITKIASNKVEKNFALEAYVPIILVKYNNDTLPLHMDTGANGTDFYTTFFEKYEPEIVTKYPKKTKKVGGAAGELTFETYQMDSVILMAGNAHATLKKVSISTDKSLGDNAKHVYGNLGQDFYSQFSEMRINFKAMSVTFE